MATALGAGHTCLAGRVQGGSPGGMRGSAPRSKNCQFSGYSCIYPASQATVYIQLCSLYSARSAQGKFGGVRVGKVRTPVFGGGVRGAGARCLAVC